MSPMQTEKKEEVKMLCKEQDDGRICVFSPKLGKGGFGVIILSDCSIDQRSF